MQTWRTNHISRMLTCDVFGGARARLTQKGVLPATGTYVGSLPDVRRLCTSAMPRRPAPAAVWWTMHCTVAHGLWPWAWNLLPALVRSARPVKSNAKAVVLTSILPSPLPKIGHVYFFPTYTETTHHRRQG